MEPKGSLPNSQELSTCFYPELSKHQIKQYHIADGNDAS
jgi:hypothetical protein